MVTVNIHSTFSLGRICFSLFCYKGLYNMYGKDFQISTSLALKFLLKHVKKLANISNICGCSYHCSQCNIIKICSTYEDQVTCKCHYSEWIQSKGLLSCIIPSSNMLVIFKGSTVKTESRTTVLLCCCILLLYFKDITES